MRRAVLFNLEKVFEFIDNQSFARRVGIFFDQVQSEEIPVEVGVDQLHLRPAWQDAQFLQCWIA